MSFWWCVHVLQHLRPHLKRHFWGRNKTNMWDSLREQVRAAEPPQPPHTHCGQKKTQKELEVRRTRTDSSSSSSSQVRTRSSTQNSDSQDSHFSASAFDALTHRSNLRLFFFSCRSPQTRSSTAPKADPDLKLWVIWGDRERQKVPEHISSAQTEASEKIFSVKLTKSLRSAERWLLPLCLQPVQLRLFSCSSSSGAEQEEEPGRARAPQAHTHIDRSEQKVSREEICSSPTLRKDSSPQSNTSGSLVDSLHCLIIKQQVNMPGGFEMSSHITNS